MILEFLFSYIYFYKKLVNFKKTTTKGAIQIKINK